MIKLRKRSALSHLIKPVFVAFLICGIFGIVWLRSSITSVEYRISELENKKMDKLKEAKILMAERASALSLQKVERTAMRDLGLIFPDRTKVVFVKEQSRGPLRASLEAR